LQDDRFGYRVSISGDYAIVSAISGWTGPVTSTGAAYIFKRNGTSWTEQLKLVDSTAFTGIQYGHSVYMDGDYAIVGEPGDNEQGSSSGSAFLYKREGENWFEIEKLLASDGGEGDDFGYSVCINDDQIIIGAPFQSTGGTYDGAAYVYTNFFTGIPVEENLTSPHNFILHQNYPNPFNPNTTIEFNLPKSGEVTLKIYNTLGEEMETLLSSFLPPGFYRQQWDASNYSSGFYFYLLQVGNKIKTKKMLLMK
jgi:hypothetical protein